MRTPTCRCGRMARVSDPVAPTWCCAVCPHAVHTSACKAANHGFKEPSTASPSPPTPVPEEER